jgi:signal transduction histidine kinase/DNA-binding NarL/FixJ family response regulator
VPTAALDQFERVLFGDSQREGEPFDLDSAYQGEAGVALVRRAVAESRPYALAIVDMRMPPGWDGLQTIAKMWEVDPRLQVVICTAYSDSSWQEIRQRFGATDQLLILKKPFDIAEVRQLACAMTEKWRLAEDQRASEGALTAARNELSKSLALAREVQEAVLDGIVVVDERGTVVTLNQRFIEIWGVPASIVASASEAELIRHQTSLVVDPAAFLATHTPMPGQLDAAATDDIRLKDGRVLEPWTGPVRASSGAIYGRLWCFRDVTERRRMDADRAVLTERMTSMGRIAAAVGHEINNPLTYAIGNVDWLAQTCAVSLEGAAAPLPLPEMAKILHATREGLFRIREIVRGLQSLSRGDEDAREDVDLVPVLDSSIQIAANEVRQRAQLVRRYEGTPLAVGTAARLGQVFLNLILNAAHSIAEGRASENRITVSCRGADDVVIVEIADTGAGIAPELLDRIFDPFFTTKGIGLGVGLGLSICRGIVEAHGGTISVSSQIGVGSTFIVTLPRGRAIVVAPVSAGQRPAVVQPSARVLIVDDEPAICEMLVRHLEERHEVIPTGGAGEAIERIDAGDRFDVILCDLMMPEMSGMDFHEIVASRYPDLAKRIVFMTGGAFTPRAKALLDSVQNDVLEKPFSVADLKRLIERYAPAIRST